MIICERRAATPDDILHAHFVQCHHIELSLHEIDKALSADGFPCLIQSEDVFSFREQRGFSSIDILADTIPRMNDSPGETYDVPLHVIEWEHQSVAEPVVCLPLVAARDINFLQQFR